MVILSLMVLGAGYDSKPKKVIPAEHVWVFSTKELEKILKKHLESLGTNVPDGHIEIKGLEQHHVFEYKGSLVFHVKEKSN